MPLYSYRCGDCDKTFETLVRGDAAPACPACGSGNLAKLVSAPSAPGRMDGLFQQARRKAAAEGHFSNYSRSERPKM